MGGGYEMYAVLVLWFIQGLVLLVVAIYASIVKGVQSEFLSNPSVDSIIKDALLWCLLIGYGNILLLAVLATVLINEKSSILCFVSAIPDIVISVFCVIILSNTTAIDKKSTVNKMRIAGSTETEAKLLELVAAKFIIFRVFSWISVIPSAIIGVIFIILGVQLI